MEETGILVTGFGPFGTVQDNPSAYLARNSGRTNHILEVSYSRAEQFVEELDRDSFHIWIMLGVSAGRQSLSLELFARNVSRGADIHGIRRDATVEPEGPLLIGSTLWTPELCAKAMTREGPRLRTSFNAGTYLCNYLLYLGLRRFPNKHVGFLHVPMPEQITLEDQSGILGRLLTEIDEGEHLKTTTG